MTDDRRLTGSKKNREVRGERRIALAKLVCIACTSVRIVRTVIFVMCGRKKQDRVRLLVCLCYNIISTELVVTVRPVIIINRGRVLYSSAIDPRKHDSAPHTYAR